MSQVVELKIRHGADVTEEDAAEDAERRPLEGPFNIYYKLLMAGYHFDRGTMSFKI